MKPLEAHVMVSNFGTSSAYLEVEIGMGIQDIAEKAIPVMCPIHFVKSWLFWVSEYIIPLGNGDSPAHMTISSRSVLTFWKDLAHVVFLDYFLEETFPHLFSAGGFPCRVRVDLGCLCAKLSDWATRMEPGFSWDSAMHRHVSF